MCTLVALHRVRADYPLVVAGNRDELYARRTASPRRWPGEPPVLAGLDLEKGGTWLGVSARGLYVGLTNQRSELPADEGLASRGEIVGALLHAASLDDALGVLATVDSDRYNPFNLLLGDGRRLFVVYARPQQRIETHELPPGVWVLPNDRIGSPDFPKIERAQTLAEPLVAASWDELIAGVPTLLGDHAQPPEERLAELHFPDWLPAPIRGALSAICVHTPRYGTRSATVAALSEGRVERFYYADGPLCRSSLIEVADLHLALAT